MKKKTENTVVINLMDCVHGTTTSYEGNVLFLKIEEALKDNCSVQISLIDASPMSSSFLNATFGELFDIYGYEKIREYITLINYKPSQAKQIKDYLESVKGLVK